MYVRALSHLTEKQLAFGFEKALKYFKPEFGKNFPYPGDFREWAEQWRPAIDESKAILDRGAKPADWEPLKPGELERMQAEGRQRAEQIEKAVETAAEERTMPVAMSATEWEMRRQRQLDEFRKKNKLGGEA